MLGRGEEIVLLILFIIAVRIVSLCNNINTSNAVEKNIRCKYAMNATKTKLMFCPVLILYLAQGKRLCKTNNSFAVLS